MYLSGFALDTVSKNSNKSSYPSIITLAFLSWIIPVPSIPILCLIVIGLFVASFIASNISYTNFLSDINAAPIKFPETLSDGQPQFKFISE